MLVIEEQAITIHLHLIRMNYVESLIILLCSLLIIYLMGSGSIHSRRAVEEGSYILFIIIYISCIVMISMLYRIEVVGL